MEVGIISMIWQEKHSVSITRGATVSQAERSKNVSYRFKKKYPRRALFGQDQFYLNIL